MNIAAHQFDIAEQYKQRASQWFKLLRDQICSEFEHIEKEYLSGTNSTLSPSHFNRKAWTREGGGGGEISLMHGNVFEKVGVNISTVFGEFSEQFRQQIPGASEDPRFFATGISLVAHPCSPKVPAVHMNTRYIVTTHHWFGGGADLTPIYPNPADTELFHHALKTTCDTFNPEYYPRFKEECDRYFYLPHRQESRGVGGIFYDYLNNGDWEQDFAFTQSVGKTFHHVYPTLVRNHMFEPWTPEERLYQLQKRGRYVEFNLLYDRGTKFGLMTNGNTEAILMSLPPEVHWP